MSDAGIDTTSSAPSTARAASARAWANVNCASKEPAGQAVYAVELASVCHPLIDQNEAGRVPTQKVNQGSARARAGPVGVCHASRTARAAQLPRQFTPQRAHIDATAPYRNQRPARSSVQQAPRFQPPGGASKPRVSKHRLDTGQFRGRSSPRQGDTGRSSSGSCRHRSSSATRRQDLRPPFGNGAPR